MSTITLLTARALYSSIHKNFLQKSLQFLVNVTNEWGEFQNLYTVRGHTIIQINTNILFIKH